MSPALLWLVVVATSVSASAHMPYGRSVLCLTVAAYWLLAAQGRLAWVRWRVRSDASAVHGFELTWVWWRV